MNMINTKEIDVDKIMNRIRAEVEKRKILPDERTVKTADESTDVAKSPSSPAVQDNTFSPKEISPVSEPVNDCSVNGMCRYHDTCFVANAYRVILGRNASADEFVVWLSKLRTGKLTKKGMLSLLRFGAEGRKKKVVIKGLLVPFIGQQLFRIPLLGGILRGIGCIVHLPVLFRNIQGLEYGLTNRFDSLNGQLLELKNEVRTVRDEQLIGLVKEVHVIRESLPQKVGWKHVSSLYKSLQHTDNRLAETDSRLEETDSRLEDTESRLQDTGSRLAETDSRLQDTESRLAETDSRLQDTESSLQDTESRLAETDSWLQELDDSLHGANHGFQEHFGQINSKFGTIEGQVRDAKFNILAQQRRLDDITVKSHFVPSSEDKQIVSKKSESEHVLDAMYVAFEDRFRGTREDITERQKVYLPYVEKVQKVTGEGEILDVGCGRGEWLELLVTNGYPAKGVDLNQIMVTQSRELGLDVVEGNVFDYFTHVASDSLSVVTGFHIVEHLPLKTMITLFDQAYRVLKPGGMVIFETPNPENILVGSCNFYYDPTHRNPIPPEALSFLLETRGYENLEIIRLHENVEYIDLKETPFSRKITERFFGPQDYSVIGYKE